MSVTVNNVSPCRKKLRIEIAAERVSSMRAEISAEFRKAAALPGFRHGKAPAPLIEKNFGKRIDEDLQKRLFNDGYREALSQQKLRVVGYPEVESVEHAPGKPLVFVAAVDTVPEFALPKYKGIPVKRKESTVKDEDIQHTLAHLQEQQSDFVDVTGRGLRTGDFAVLNYSAVADGKPLAELAPSAKPVAERKDFWVLVQSGSFLPGFCDQLLGAQIGEKRQVLVDFPADFPIKMLVGKKATYFVDVTGIKERKLPELNDEFAKKIGAESLEKLKVQIRDGIAAEKENETRTDMRKQIVDHLLAKTPFDLPESLVAAEARSIVYDMVRENTMRGVAKDELEKRKDEILGFATQSAKDRLRSSFILSAIADVEQIKVEEKEIEERLVQLAERHRVTPEHLKAQLVERDGLGEIEEQIRVSKTLDFLLGNGKVETVTEG
ncbi:MAG: trigger factor [Verrucomicrobiia bacterium]